MIGFDIVSLNMAYTYSRINEILARVLENTAFYIYRIFTIRRNEIKKQDGIEKILILEPFGMREVASLSVMIEPLKNKFPGASIFILTNNRNEDIFEFDQRVDLITSQFPWSDNKKKWSIQRYIRLLTDIVRIRKLKISIGIDPRGDIRSQIILLIAGCRERLGYTGYLNSNIITRGLLLTERAEKPLSVHRYDRNLHLLNYLGIKNIYPVKFPSIDVSSIDIGIKRNDVKSVLIHPEEGWFYKKWPESNWIKLIEKLSENRRIKISVIGSREEKEILARIHTSVNDDRIEFKTTNIKDLIASIKYSDLFICQDSDEMDLAVCMNKPVIALFGPGDSAVWRPYSSKSSFIHKKENFPCNPCHQKKCYYPQNNCMAMISVEDVINSVNNYISTV